MAHARRQFEGVLRVNFRIHKIGVILPHDIFRLSQLKGKKIIHIYSQTTYKLHSTATQLKGCDPRQWLKLPILFI